MKFIMKWIVKQWNKLDSGKGEESANPVLAKLRSRIFTQAGLAVLTVALTVVLIVGMTAAWYNNIVTTGGLIFEVQKWGIDVNAQIKTDRIVAYPGREGIISFEVNNPGTDILGVQVSTTKNGMDSQMQKRIFFYVDAQQTINGETLQRTWLNSLNGYEYTLLGMQTLSVSEQYYNDVPIRWCWVDHVLGYYVRATVNTDNSAITILEYLQPVEYDSAKVKFDTETGNVSEIDGVALIDYLAALTENDGYTGAIVKNDDSGTTPSAVTYTTVTDATTTENGTFTEPEPDTYYFIQNTDTAGEGIYLCLYDHDEITAANAYDAELNRQAGELEDKGEVPMSYPAQFTVYADAISADSATMVSTVEELQNALISGAGGLITLGADITVSEPITTAGNTELILNLNGKKLETSTAQTAIRVEEGSTLTVYNGSLTGGDSSGHAIESVGANVTLSNVNVSGYVMGVRISDHNSTTGRDSTVRLVSCTFNTDDCPVFIRGNGEASEQNTKLIIEGCTLRSKDAVLFGNGSPNQAGTDIQIIDSTLESYELATAAIYHPQEGTLNIVGSTIIGHTGICVKGGTVVVANSDITGNGGKLEEAAYLDNGFAATGDAIFIEAYYCGRYGQKIHVEIDSESTLTSSAAEQLRLYAEGNDGDYVTVDCKINSVTLAEDKN